MKNEGMRGAMKHLVIVGMGLCAGLVADSARAQSMAGPSLAQAQAGLVAAEAAAVEMGIGLTCAVVDARGTLVALARMDNARYFTSDIAVGKARASASFGAPSGALSNIAAMGLADVIEGGGNMLFLQGAVPISVNGQPVGALGCSGAASEQDENAAKAGVAAMQ